MSIEIIILTILVIIICIVLISNQIKLEKKMNKINEVLAFQQSFNIQLQKSNNNKLKLKGEELYLRSDYLLLLFSKNVKINLLLLRINLF